MRENNYMTKGDLKSKVDKIWDTMWLEVSRVRSQLLNS